jgi:hypothetical protein
MGTGHGKAGIERSEVEWARRDTDGVGGRRSEPRQEKRVELEISVISCRTVDGADPLPVGPRRSQK